MVTKLFSKLYHIFTFFILFFHLYTYTTQRTQRTTDNEYIEECAALNRFLCKTSSKLSDAAIMILTPWVGSLQIFSKICRRQVRSMQGFESHRRKMSNYWLCRSYLSIQTYSRQYYRIR
jgi:hypothetical protein